MSDTQTTPGPTPAPAPPAATPAATLPASPRRGRKALRVALTILLAAAVIAAAVFAFNLITARQRATDDLNAAQTALSRADVPLQRIDRTIRSEVTTATPEAVADALDDVATATEELDQALASAQDSLGGLAKADVPFANAVIEAITTRQRMLAQAAPILTIDARVAQVIQPARQAWELVAQAEKLADQAVVEFNRHTKAGVEQSTKLTGQASTQLREARSLLATVTAGVPEADLAPFTQYIDGKLGLLTRSQAIDATWLAGKVADANKLLDAYNAEEQKLVARAKELPESPTAVVADAYKSLTEQLTDRYFEARDAVLAADEQMRSFVNKRN